MKTYKELLSEMAQDPHKAGYKFHVVQDGHPNLHTIVAYLPLKDGEKKPKFLSSDNSVAVGQSTYNALPDHIKDRVVGKAEIQYVHGKPGTRFEHTIDRPYSVLVAPKHRRKGVASGMYDKYKEHTGRDVIPSEHQSDEAVALWKDRRKKR